MGLDITAYRQLKKIEAVFDADGEPLDAETHEPLDGNWVKTYLNSDFPGRADDLEHKAVYGFVDSMGFSAGGYGGYNHWREELAKLAGYPATPFKRHINIEMRHDAGAWAASEGPFWELINFSDCEGVIGSTVSTKLSRDFADFDAKAAENGEYFYQRYTNWKSAFEMASDGGCVDFH